MDNPTSLKDPPPLPTHKNNTPKGTDFIRLLHLEFIQCQLNSHSIRNTLISHLHFTEEHFGMDSITLAIGMTFIFQCNVTAYFSTLQTGIQLKKNLLKVNLPLNIDVLNLGIFDAEIVLLSKLATVTGKKEGVNLRWGVEKAKNQFMKQAEIVYAFFYLILDLLQQVVVPLEAVNADDCFWLLGVLIVESPTEDDCFNTIFNLIVATRTVQQSSLLEDFRIIWMTRNDTPTSFPSRVKSIIASLGGERNSNLATSLKDVWRLLERAGLRNTILLQHHRVVKMRNQQVRNVNVNASLSFSTSVVAMALRLCLNHPATKDKECLVTARTLLKAHICERNNRRSESAKRRSVLRAAKRPLDTLPSSLSLEHEHVAMEQNIDNTLVSISSLQRVTPLLTRKQVFSNKKLPPPLPSELESSFLLKDTSRKHKVALFDLWAKQGNPNVSSTSTAIYLESALRLKGDWIKDDFINIFFEKLNHISLKTASPSTSKKLCWFYSSFFFTRAMHLAPGSGFGLNPTLPNDGLDKSGKFVHNQYNYRLDDFGLIRYFKRLPRGTTIFDLDKLCIPVNFAGIHWMLCVVLVEDQQICVYDSLLDHKFDSYLVRSVVFQYILDEYKRIHDKPMSTEEINAWRFTDKVLSAPQQRNTRDCGVFTVLFGEHCVNGLPLDILRKELHDPQKYVAIITRARLRLASIILFDLELE